MAHNSRNNWKGKIYIYIIMMIIIKGVITSKKQENNNNKLIDVRLVI